MRDEREQQQQDEQEQDEETRIEDLEAPAEDAENVRGGAWSWGASNSGTTN